METTPFTIGLLKNTSIVSITNGILNPTKDSGVPNGTEVCIPPEIAFTVAVSSGGIIIVLLISTLVLTCKVIALKQRCQARRPHRSNMDLVSGTGYWGTETIEGGIVGPCETNLLLEEVKDGIEEEEVNEEAEEPILHHGTASNMDVETAPVLMQTSASRDSCIDPKELEDMPLMV